MIEYICFDKDAACASVAASARCSDCPTLKKAALPVQPDIADLLEADAMLKEIGKICRQQTRFVGSYAKIVRQAIALQPTDRNFCQRCGQRLGDDTYIHTCSLPESKA